MSKLKTLKDIEGIEKGIVKAMMMKEALASCQIEGIGLDLTLEYLYLEEAKRKLEDKK